MPEQIRFLLATDTHVGYGENKKNIHNDSFTTFEEVLKNAQDQDVDFILLAGDLFHEPHPTRETQLKVVRLLREYCLREGRTVDLKLLSDPTVVFDHSSFPTVNYDDGNFKIGMPIFTINGNHDDLSGKGLSSLDVLHEAGLINLFGKFCDVDHINCTPLLLRKGDCNLAIYGIGSQRDDRLCRSFKQGTVKFLRPTDGQTWFSILVVHQNRPRRDESRTTGAHLPLFLIPTFFDLVIWGHEHESQIAPKYFTVQEGDIATQDNGFFVIQPGSTIATSLSREECKQKHCGVVTVMGQQFKCDPIPLKSTRQVLVDELILAESEPAKKLAKTTVRQKDMPVGSAVYLYLYLYLASHAAAHSEIKDEVMISRKLEQMIRQAKAERDKEGNPDRPKLPLIALKVIYSGIWLNIPPINGRRFGAKYADRVANATEMLSVRCDRDKSAADGEVGTRPSLAEMIEEGEKRFQGVDEMVVGYYTGCEEKNRLRVLNELQMCRALKEYNDAESTIAAVDKSFAEQMHKQIDTYSSTVKEAMEGRVQDGDDENDDALLRKIERCCDDLRRERAAAAHNDETTDEDGESRKQAQPEDVEMADGDEW